jgi:hypothetical protein
MCIRTNKGGGQSAQVDQMVPVAVVACQARRLQGEYRSRVPFTHACQQLAKPGALLQTRAALTACGVRPRGLPRGYKPRAKTGEEAEGLLATMPSA